MTTAPPKKTDVHELPRPWCTESGHDPNSDHDVTSLCAVAWELGISEENDLAQYAELRKRLDAARRRALKRVT
jgi:hypothetical protein